MIIIQPHVLFINISLWQKTHSVIEFTICLDVGIYVVYMFYLGPFIKEIQYTQCDMNLECVD